MEVESNYLSRFISTIKLFFCRMPALMVVILIRDDKCPDSDQSVGTFIIRTLHRLLAGWQVYVAIQPLRLS